MGMNTILVGMTICLLLLASPVAASDYTLGVFGNANEDDTINMQDVTQIELIILGKEKELTLLDSVDIIVTVKKPIERVVVAYYFTLETLRAIKVPREIIVGVPNYPNVADWELYFVD
jgi:iron complex transport system substrate-binding protein